MTSPRQCGFSFLMLLASAVVCSGQPTAEHPAIAAAKKRQEALKTVEFVFL